MTHQIVLLGGQLLPVYLGVLERKPKVVHILYTKETVRHKTRLVRLFEGVRIFDYQIDPYDYDSIQETVTDIICNYEGVDFELNLTSGTKLMALASQQVFKSLDCFSFYVDQKQNIIDLSDGSKTKISSLISTKMFLSLSDHNNFTSSTLKAFNEEEMKLANSILELRKDKSGIGELFKLFRSLRIDSELRNFSFSNSKYEISWRSNILCVKAPRFSLNAEGKNSFKILTTGLWWELIIGMAISKWKSAVDVHMSLAIKSNKDANMDKNEIDILVNTGHNVFFIECKSGIVTQSDLNKIRTVSKLYGGLSSKSILASFFKPKDHLLEKCQDLGIEVFCLNGDSNIPVELNSISKSLDRLLSRVEL
ncbi:Card1-like endonuclease domain-containing protein [Gelidibacter pelagius]|uniref:DUF1887 family protein n=1 Tax=Gelidibacter pelagius TaxID=2819985 RepID=A0ABS3SM86_9FLAO|nr:DUF1887 family CARF protein [Gelidibacter pelagius]MBO3096825.1 DUF1887 family protein [Gelidibacter pelagius]